MTATTHDSSRPRSARCTGLLLLLLGLLVSSRALAVGTWTPLHDTAPGSVWLMLLLSDGTVMCANNPVGLLGIGQGNSWFRLTPDIHGSYIHGTWTRLASAHDSRLFYSSQVLANGQVFVAGGEYGSGRSHAEIYDPVANAWTQINPPLSLMDPSVLSPILDPSDSDPHEGFVDSICKILPDGTVLVAPVGANSNGETMIYNPASGTWSAGGATRSVYQDEASWVKLPDDSILTIDPFGTHSERYIPSLNQWVADAEVPVAMYDSAGKELGAAFLLPNGKAFFLGATGRTAFYTPSPLGGINHGTWAEGPNIPGDGQGFPLAAQDAPAAMMVNGKILCAFGHMETQSGGGPAPTYFFEYDYVANLWAAAPAPGNSAIGSTDDAPTFQTMMLDLPDGTVLYSHVEQGNLTFNDYGSQLYVYTPDGSPLAAGKPTITSITANPDGSYHLVGTGLNGISEGAAFGDDAQMNSNYPLVRLTDSHGLVYYARSFNWSSTGVMTGSRSVTTEFTAPVVGGQYSLVVVANGIASDPFPFHALGATDRHWTGSANGNWSNPNNWDPVGAPQNGENLIFDHDSHTSMVNDLSDLAVQSLTFLGLDAGLTLSDVSLTGNPLTITGSIEASSGVGHSYSVTISCALTLTDNVRLEVYGGNNGFNTPNELHMNGPIGLNGRLFLFAQGPNNGSRLYLSGAVSGNGDVYADEEFSNGNIIVDGAQGNTFSGTLFVGALGDVIVGDNTPVLLKKSSGLAIPGQLNIVHGQVDLGGAEQIADTATVTIQNGSKLFLQGYNETIGSLVLSNVSADAEASVVDTGGGTLTVLGDITSSVDNQSVVPTVKGNLSLPNGGHTFDVSGSVYAGLDMQAQITGLGGFNKFGNAALLLESSNSFRGEIGVNQGILEVRNNHALGQTFGGTALLGSVSLTLRNVSIAGETLFVRGNQPVTVDTAGSLLFTVGTCAWTGPINLYTNLVVFGDNTTLSGQISGVGGLDFRNGTATIGGSGTNTFTGTTLVRCPLLEFNKPYGVRAFAGPLVVGGGTGGPYEARWLNSYQNNGPTATLYANGIINLANHYEAFGPVTFNGGVVDSGAGGYFMIFAPLTVNPAASSAVVNGNLGLSDSADPVFIVGQGSSSCDLVVNAVISPISGGGNKYLQKQGTGKMCLTAANTFADPILLKEGIIYVNNSGGLSSGGVIIFDGATLQVDGAYFPTLANNLDIVGAGVGGTHGALEVIGGDLSDAVLTGAIFVEAATIVNVAEGSELDVNGAISGIGPLTKIGGGLLKLGGTAGNSYSGDTIVTAGELLLAKPFGVAAVPGNLVLGPASASALASAQFNNSALVAGTAITVNSHSTLYLNGNAQALAQLNLNDGGSAQTGAGALVFSSGGQVVVGSQSPSRSHVHSSISGNIQIAGNSLLTFSVNPYAISFPFDPAPELDVPAAIYASFEQPQFAPAGIAKEGLGRMRLGGNNTYKGRTAVNGGTLQMDGAQPQGFVVVNSGARLQGAGTIGPLFMNGSSAVLAPGDSPGILTCSNFDAGGGSGVLEVELNGTTPGVGYDQLNVRGTVNLTGISLSGLLNFSSSVANQFLIINNDGADAVIGTFTGLPQGTNLYIGGQLFQISYKGGTGNDVVLTRLTTPPLPALAIQHLSSSSIVFSWPTNDPAFTVQSSTNLSTNAWGPVSPPPVIVGGNFVLSNTPSGPQRFYRLIKP